MPDKILIIDDDRDLRVGLCARLRANGYDTTFAVDAVEAISKARREQPSLIILDIGLPAGDGFVVMDRLNDLPDLAGVPVIVLSARDPSMVEERSRDAGALAYFQKPADNEALLSAIWDALRVGNA